jgi:hypothetical protein
MTARVQNITAAERFWPQVDQSDGCWLWTGYVKPNGYASFYPGGGRGVAKVYAHRFSYEMHKGAIPESMEIDHTCNVRSCVNPDHLEAVTHRVNLDRAVDRRTHCKSAHPLSGANLYVWRGNRSCRTCRDAAEARRPERMSMVRGV